MLNSKDQICANTNIKCAELMKPLGEKKKDFIKLCADVPNKKE